MRVLHVALECSVDQCQKIRLQAQQDRLRFRVAEPAVVFERAQIALRVDHEAGVEESDVRQTILRHALHRRLDDFAHYACVEFGRDHGCRRVRTHAAGVGAQIIVPQAFVVLARGERKRVVAVAHDDEARFLADETFLDHDPRARVAHAGREVQGVDRIVRLRDRGCDDHALARGEPVRLDHDGRTLLRDIGLGLRSPFEGGVARSRNAMPHHEALGEVL